MVAGAFARAVVARPGRRGIGVDVRAALNLVGSIFST